MMNCFSCKYKVGDMDGTSYPNMSNINGKFFVACKQGHTDIIREFYLEHSHKTFGMVDDVVVACYKEYSF